MYILEHSRTWNIWDHVLLGLSVFCPICLFDIRNSHVRLQYNEEVYVHPIKNGFGWFWLPFNESCAPNTWTRLLLCVYLYGPIHFDGNKNFSITSILHFMIKYKKAWRLKYWKFVSPFYSQSMFMAILNDTYSEVKDEVEHRTEGFQVNVSCLEYKV